MKRFGLAKFFHRQCELTDITLHSALNLMSEIEPPSVAYTIIEQQCTDRCNDQERKEQLCEDAGLHRGIILHDELISTRDRRRPSGPDCILIDFWWRRILGLQNGIPYHGQC